MYSVNLKINNQEYSIHDDNNKLISGSVKQGINSINSFSFSILPNNVGFNLIRDFKTLISVYNEKRGIYEFQGRVLYSSNSMDSSGKIKKDVVCESFLGYLQDSRQEYVYEQNWTPTELLTQLLNVHNSQVEEEKQFKVGNVELTENIYIGIQRESTWKMIDEKIIQKVGGEIQLRVEEDGMYIDILKQRGTTRATTIELSKNMLSITRESDPSSYITRLIPLGAKLKDEEGNDTEERVDITSVNDGLNYIDDVTAIEKFGIHIDYQYWDDVNEPTILKTKATNFLTENNKILQKFKIDTLDLALIGIDIDFIDVCNYYPIKNDLLGIDEVLRVITKTIDIVNETKTSVEIGDNFKTLSDLEIERDNQLNDSINTIKTIEKNYQVNIPKIQKDITELQERKSVENTKVMYYLSSSNSELVGGNWVDTPPEWVDGKYYWQKVITTFSDETTSESKPVCITGGTGATGETGASGKDGANGNDGVGIESITTQFYLSTSKTEQIGGEWVGVMPEWTTGMYLWTRSLITYTDKTTEYTEPICDSSWEAANDVEENLNNIIQSVSTDLSSLINQTSTEIQSIVSETYTSKSAFEQYQETVSTQFTQTKDSFDMTFTEIVQSITAVDGKVNSNYAELEKYIRFKGGIITLGEVDNPLTLELSNDKMAFKQNGVEVAYITDNKLYIYDAELINSLKIGRWVFIPRSNNNLSFTFI